MSTLDRSNGLPGAGRVAGRLRTALVHERLNVMAGSDKVVQTIHNMLPDAPIFTALADQALLDAHFPDADVRTSFLQRVPFVAKHHQKLLLLYMLAFEQFDLSEFDLVISSSHCAAKAVITKPHACHICYCYSPMRYAWDLQHEYTRLRGRLFRAAWAPVSSYIRMWDLGTASRVDYFVAISNYIARRIRKFYGRTPAAVIYPPVEVDRFSPSTGVGDYYLVVSRFAPYKRVDLVIEAFNLLGWRLVVVGNGEQESYLRKLGKPNIEFKGSVSDDELVDWLAGARGLIHAAEEDFGINMVESLASGRPVVAYGVGGAAEIVDHGDTGVLFHELTVESLINAVKECEAMTWDPYSIRQSSLRFSTEVFQQQLAAVVEWAIADFPNESRGLVADSRLI